MMDEVRLGPGSAARFAAFGALILFLCWQHVQATRLGYRVESARKSARDRGSRVAMLRVRLEERLSPAEVAARASRLGLIPAAPDALRRLPETSGSRAPSWRLWARALSPFASSSRG